MKSRTTLLCAFLILAVANVAVADDFPLVNWEVPTGDLQKHVDITDAVPFVGMQPCRIVYTLGGAPWGATQWGTPALVQNATRNFDLNSAPHCTGIPTAVEAYSLNVTVVAPGGPGDLRIWPQDSPPATPTSVMNWSQFGGAFAIANALIIPAGTGGGVTVQMAGTSGHLIIDINGFFTGDSNVNTWFDFHVSDSSTAAHIQNTNTTGMNYGVWGDSNSSGTLAAGVFGRSLAGSGRVYGVYGLVTSPADDTAGVLGIDASGSPSGSLTTFPAGVRGESTTDRAILGHQADTATAQTLLTRRISGAGGETIYGALTCSNTISACGNGGTAFVAPKAFVEPHPTDATKTIKYISLEGPEAGTYFRGRGRFHRGLATIDVPEDFRMVTADEGLSIQVTPIGDMATVAVMQIGLDRIVVKGSRNVEFFYTVNGVRRAFAKHEPITQDNFFVPENPDFLMPLVMSAEHKARLIANGTYNADGTPNMKTAKRLGWDKRWTKEPKESPDAPVDAHAGKK